MVGLGWILIQPGSSTDANESFAFLRTFMSEQSWGVALLLAGITRTIGLIINGSIEAVTPWIRVAGAITGFTFFALIFFSMLVAVTLADKTLPTGLAVYGVLSAMEVAAMYLAVIDARIYQNGRRLRSSKL
jgi:hypothetical protein